MEDTERRLNKFIDWVCIKLDVDIMEFFDWMEADKRAFKIKMLEQEIDTLRERIDAT